MTGGAALDETLSDEGMTAFALSVVCAKGLEELAFSRAPSARDVQLGAMTACGVAVIEL